MSIREIAYSSRELIDYAQLLAGAHVLIVGDIMLDEYYLGDAERISPEAPVPVVKISEDRLFLGGAGNVARNIKSLAGQAQLLSVCGDDSGAEVIDGLCRTGGVSAKLIRIPHRRTTIKTRIIARQQQMLRFDQEDISAVPSEYLYLLLNQVKARLTENTVLIISDYGKGLITPLLMSELRKLQAECAAAGNSFKILVDPKTPNWRLYEKVFVLTPNAKETSEGVGMPVNSVEEIKQAGAAALEGLACRYLLATLGAQGMALFLNRNKVWHIPTAARKVFDVTGAGDTVIAVLGLALAAGIPLLPGCLLANAAAGIVVGEVGAAAVNSTQLCEALASVEQYTAEPW